MPLGPQHFWGRLLLCFSKTRNSKPFLETTRLPLYAEVSTTYEDNSLELVKIVVVQLVKTSRALYGTRKFITTDARACHFSLSCARWIQFTFQSCSLTSIVLFISYLCLDLPSGLLSSGWIRHLCVSKRQRGRAFLHTIWTGAKLHRGHCGYDEIMLLFVLLAREGVLLLVQQLTLRLSLLKAVSVPTESNWNITFNIFATSQNQTKRHRYCFT
jgi:hypothetical protein